MTQYKLPDAVQEVADRLFKKSDAKPIEAPGIDYTKVPPVNGWDAAIDLAQADKFLAEMTFKDGIAEPDAWEPSIKYLQGERSWIASRDQIVFVATRFRDFGLQRRTAHKKLAGQFKDVLHGNDFALKQLSKAVFFAYDEAKHGPAGTASQAGRETERGGFDKGDNGKPKMTAGNVAVALVRMGVTLRYDIFRDRYLIAGLKGFGPELSDAAINRLRLTFERPSSFGRPRILCSMLLYDLAHKNAFDPVTDFFAEVECQWDFEKRIDRFLIDYAGAEDTPLRPRGVSLVVRRRCPAQSPARREVR